MEEVPPTFFLFLGTQRPLLARNLCFGAMGKVPEKLFLEQQQ